MLTYVNICEHMLTYFYRCQDIFRYVNIFLHVLTYFYMCQHILVYVNILTLAQMCGHGLA